MSRPQTPPAADERTTLEAFLDYQRATMLIKAEGLDRKQLNQRLPTSELTLAGLLKHQALVEDDWVQVRFCGRPELGALGQRAMGTGPRLGVPHRRA